MTNKEIKKDKASALAVAMIILGLVLSIALSTSLVSILGNKASISSNKSNLAYSRADSGVESLLLKIKNADPDTDTIASIDTDGTCNGVVQGTNFKVELKDVNGNLITDCGQKVSSIRTIKSTGIADNNQRAIEVAVAESQDCDWVPMDTGANQGENFIFYSDFGDHSPTEMCKKGGYSSYTGACKFELSGYKYEGSVLANTYSFAYNWAISCMWGGNAYYFTPEGEILCCK